MKKEMKKEVLTTESIKKDLRKYFFCKIKRLLQLLLLLTPLVFIAVMNTGLSFGRSTKTIATIVIFGISFIMISYAVVTVIIGLIQTKKGKFTITSDWVIDKVGAVAGNSPRKRTFRIIFAKSGAYNIPYGVNYQWSKMFATSAETLYEYTDINEDFYVISIGQKNVMAYRKKHFEIEEQ